MTNVAPEVPPFSVMAPLLVIRPVAAKVACAATWI
jgi:hypothetical protein